MKKRILSASLAAVIGLSSVVPAFAAVTPADGLLNATGEYANSTGSIVADKDAVDINGVVGKDTTQGKYSQYDTVVDGYTGTTMDETKSEVNVYATVAPSYSIKIPKTIILSSSGLGLYDIGVKGDMSGAQTLTIRPDDKITDTTETDFYMSEQNAFVGKKDDIVAVVEQSKTEWIWSDINKADYTWLAEAGKITANDISAGSWAGTFDFVIGMNVDKAPVSVTTNYTKEEVDANEYLIPIGKTDPYNVIVEFNEDYTEATITKNGENSDGLMMDWDMFNGVSSPMTEKVATLQRATVKEGVTSIGNFAFTGIDLQTGQPASKIQNVELAKTVQQIGEYAFMGCSEITEIKIPDNLYYIGSGAFYSCSSLAKVNLPNNLTEINNYVFTYCSSLGDMHLDENIKSIGEFAFAHCTSIESVSMSDNVTEIGSAAFAGCTSLANIKISNKVRVLNNTFQNTALTDVVIPYGVEALEDRIFNDCSQLTSVTIPASVTIIYDYAFNGSENFVIKGEAGSYAETWANTNGYTFIAI